jgi:hypothetical protein
MMGGLLVAIITCLCARAPSVRTLVVEGPPGFASNYYVVRQICLVGRRGLAAELGWADRDTKELADDARVDAAASAVQAM